MIGRILDASARNRGLMLFFALALAVAGWQSARHVRLDPVRLRSFGLSIADVARAVRRSNADVGGRVVEQSEREYFVRGRGYVARVQDLEDVVLRASASGTPVLLRDVASVRIGGDIRRGAADLDGVGETVSGIIVMRDGENALDVIRRVEHALDALGT